MTAIAITPVPSNAPTRLARVIAFSLAVAFLLVALNAAGNTPSVTQTHSNIHTLTVATSTAGDTLDPSYNRTLGYNGLNQRVSVTQAGVKTYEVYGSHGTLLTQATPSQAKTSRIWLPGVWNCHSVQAGAT